MSEMQQDANVSPNFQSGDTPLMAEGAEQALDPAVPISPLDWEEVVGVWVNEHIRNSPVAQNTSGWNHLMASLPHLLTYVNAHLKKG